MELYGGLNMIDFHSLHICEMIKIVSWGVINNTSWKQLLYINVNLLTLEVGYPRHRMEGIKPHHLINMTWLSHL